MPIYCLIFFVSTTTILTPPPPLPILSILKSKNICMLYWFNFQLVFQTHHTLPYPTTYLSCQHRKLPVKESEDANSGCRFWRFSIFHFLPAPDCQQPHYPHPLPPCCPEIDPVALGNYVKSYMKLSHFCPKAWQYRKDDGWSASQGFCVTHISIIFFEDPRISIYFSVYYIFLVGCSIKEGWLATQTTPPGSKLLRMCYQLIDDEWRK